MSVRKGTDDVVGSELAGYLLEGLIGRGGMGAVYRARELGLERTVALKVIAPELAEDHRFRERFLRESRVAASLDHPHVVPIFKAGEDKGALFLAMRYVEGTDLGKLLAAEGALEPGRAIALLEQVAEALDAAHEQGLVHRDVKPSNVLIARAAGKEHCYLADFGLTKRTGSLSGVSAPGDVVGTLEYVAPEQITGDDVEASADLYWLGCVLYESLTGQSPFPRATDVALLWAHVHEEPVPPSKARPELPRALDTVLARTLAKDPSRRYASAGELVAAARSALGLTTPVPAARTPRWLLAAAAVVALAGVAAALALTLGRDPGGLTSVSPNSVGVIDPATNELVAEVPAGSDPGPIAFGAGSVWVANVEDETVSRIDPATHERGRTISVGGSPSDLTVGGETVWAALGALAELTRINPNQDAAATPIPALPGNTPCVAGSQASVASGSGEVWFLCENGELGRVDPRTGTPTSIGLEAGLLTSPDAIASQYTDIAFGLGALWVVNGAANAVIEIDPATNQELDKHTVGRAPTAIAVGSGALWVTNFDDDSVTRLVAGGDQAPTTDEFNVGDGPVDVTVGEGGVWVASALDRTVARLDPATGETVATIEIGNEPQRVAAGGGAVWVSVRAAEQAGG